MKIFFKPPKSVESLRIYYMYTNAIILAGILFFSLLGERYVWHIWGVEFQHTACVIGSILLLIVGVLCTYFTAKAVARRRAKDISMVDKVLQDSEEEFKKFLEYAPIAVAILDKNNNTEYANKKYLEIIGYDDHINLLDWFLLAYPDKDYRKLVIERWDTDVAKALREGKEVEPSEYIVTCKDGKIRVMEISATFVSGKTIALFTDITERKRAEETVAKSEERFRLLTENSIDCVWTMDKRLRFTYLSPTSLERIMGVTVSDWVGTKLISHFSKKEFLKVGALTAKSLRNYKGASHVVFETKMFDGRRKEIDVEISSRALFDGKGKLIGLQGVTKDITDRKQAERELAKYRDHLEKLVKQRTAELANRVSEVEKLNIEMVNLSGGLKTSNKSLEATTGQLTLANKELESFAYSVSHDLRAPLRSIDGFSQILLEDYSDVLDTQGKHYLNRVRTGTQNMGQLIDDILSLSRSGRHTMDKKTINMESIVKEVCNPLKNELKDRKVDFVINDCPPILADPHLIKIVLTNLLSNAVKFTRIRENAKIETGSMTKDGQTIFFVKDNGIGFDMQYADKLFAAFQRLHSAEEYEGSGIGLAIVQRIINRHGGRVWAESEIDVGATFYFTL